MKYLIIIYRHVTKLAEILANYLLLYLALKESFERGIKLVHYGGGLTNSVDDPLFKFKKKFSNTS